MGMAFWVMTLYCSLVRKYQYFERRYCLPEGETVYFAEMLIPTYRTTERCHYSEDNNMNVKLVLYNLMASVHTTEI